MNGENGGRSIFFRLVRSGLFHHGKCQFRKLGVFQAFRVLKNLSLQINLPVSLHSLIHAVNTVYQYLVIIVNMFHPEFHQLHKSRLSLIIGNIKKRENIILQFLEDLFGIPDNIACV